MAITQSQKQALIDNLQLEVAERARHLRAHYALQCADLQARAERRINRIPMALRKANMGELYAKHLEASQAKAVIAAPTTQYNASSTAKTSRNAFLTLNHPLPPIPQNTISRLPSPPRPVTAQSHTIRGKKRKSEEITIASDKENEEQEAGPESLGVVKNPKRVKTGPAPRQASRTTKPGSVLSPKSHNSRTFPRSPIKDYTAMPASPMKQSYIARPISPFKPASPLKSAASAATSAITASLHGMVEHAKRGTAATAGKLTRTASREKPSGIATAKNSKMLPPPRDAAQRTASQSSSHSTTSSTSVSSTSTTVVNKGAKSKATTSTKQTTVTAAASKKAASAAKTALKKNAATTNKKVVLAEPAAGRRVLRKRN